MPNFGNTTYILSFSLITPISVFKTNTHTHGGSELTETWLWALELFISGFWSLATLSKPQNLSNFLLCGKGRANPTPEMIVQIK